MRTSKNLLLLGIIVSAFLTSCSTQQDTTYYYRYDESTARYINPEMRATFISPTIADLDISSNKITESVTYDNKLTLIDIQNLAGGQTSNNIEQLKSMTISKAVKKYNADVIVAPIFDIVTSKDYNTITVSISGYPATYKNFRKVTNEDAAVMRVYGIEIATPQIVVP